MPRRHRIFTPTTIEIIRQMAAEGKTADEIAVTIGSTSGSVRVRCSKLKIKLNSRGYRRSPRGELSQNQDQRNQSRSPRLYIYLPPLAYSSLSRKAARMNKSVDELARMLLETIASSELYEAVLDLDDGE
jgi:DNA-binding CsgD family transcriptional regulator